MNGLNQVKKVKTNYANDRPGTDNPVKVQDVTFRDGHQSLFATRGRTEDMIPVAEMMDAVGFWAMEVWGGATFDTMHRFLNEDPWERIRTLKRYIKKTPFSMLLRGQNLVGYRNYADDVARAFVERACVNGIDIFRTFDALNDFRNFATVVPVIRECNKHFQGCICYSLTEPRMGGDVYTIEYYISKAKDLEEMGADSICIKDMAGLIAPYDAYELVKALKETVKPPIHLHSHFTSGMAQMSHLKAIEAGVDIVDTCMSPYAFRTSQPAIEPLVMTLLGTNRDTGFDIHHLAGINEILEKEILPKYRHLLDDTKVSVIDINVLLHQTPGGMLSNLVNQLKELDALDRIDEVYAELPRVRKDLGQVPLVTPTSQIVGIQTVNNVLFDDKNERYKMITAQVKDLCFGLYGKTPVQINPEVQKRALRGYDRGEEPIACRPAEILEPELEKAKKETEGLAVDLDDVLIASLYPVTGKRFLKWKYGKEQPPDEVKPRTLEEVKAEEELIERAKTGKAAEKNEKETPPKGTNLRVFNVFVDDEFFEVGVEEAGVSSVTSSISPTTAQIPSAEKPPEAATAASAQQKTAAPEPLESKVASEPTTPKEAVNGTPLTAPMPGMIIRFEKNVGDSVNEGEAVVVVEAMKMENSLPAPVSGTIEAIKLSSGDSVAKGDVLCVISDRESIQN